MTEAESREIVDSIKEIIEKEHTTMAALVSLTFTVIFHNDDHTITASRKQH
jgi:hypothetical protein